VKKLSKKKEMQKIILIVATSVDQQLINDLGFGEYLKKKRAELIKKYSAKTVTISVFGKAVFIIGFEKSTEEIDKVGFGKYLYNMRGELMREYQTKQAFVVAV